MASEIHPPDDVAKLDRALGQMKDYDWVIFTSANGAGGTESLMLWEDARLFGEAKIAAIGPRPFGRAHLRKILGTHVVAAPSQDILSSSGGAAARAAKRVSA